MPYESFKCSHHVSIRGLVQDRQTGSWRYFIKVKRVMQDDTPTSCASQSNTQRDFDDYSMTHSRSPSSLAKALWQRRSSSSFMNTPTSPTNSSSAFGYSQVYSIRRSFAEFKLLHAAMKPLMKSSSGSSESALPSLPVDSIFAFFVGETQTMLQKKRLTLENILIAIENHGAAADSSEYLEFLAKTDTYEQVSKAPMSPPSSFTSSCGSTTVFSSLASTATTSSSLSSRADTEPSRTSGLNEFTTSREAETHRIPTRAYHSNDQQQQQHKKRRGRGARRQSVTPEAKQTTAENKLPPVARENRVDFNRYSLC